MRCYAYRPVYVHRWGDGPKVVLVHGAVLGGREAWRAQRPLTARWTLLAPDRPGHGRSDDARQDFEADARLVADELLREPVHVVGHSYGAIVAMLAAAKTLDKVKSLTVIEPPATRAAAGNPAVHEWAEELQALFSDPGDDLRSLLARFFRTAGVRVPVPDPMPHALERGTRALVGARPPTEADLPLDALASSDVPCLVVSGGHSRAYEAICDAIAEKTRSERAVIRGAAHVVPDTGRPFNRLLEAFLLRST